MVSRPTASAGFLLLVVVVTVVVVTVGMMSGRGPRRERRRAERDSRGKSEQCSAFQHDTSLQGS
jgi:Tfp pilus assembly protein PilX